jgi:hypothetical protein
MDAPSGRQYKELGDVLLSAIGDREPYASLARRMYVSEGAIHNWMSGKRRPEPGRLGYLGALYDLPIERLARLAGYDCDPDALDKVLNAYHDSR